MIVFIPAPAAEALSEALWSLARPAHLRGDADTARLFGTLTDLQGALWLEVDTDAAVIIHPEAAFAPIAAILQPWIDDGHLPADTNTQLAALVDSKRGERLVIYDAFPAFFKGMAQTREALSAAGLLPAAPQPHAVPDP